MGMTRTIRLTASEKAAYLEQLEGSGKGRVFQLVLDIMSLGRTGENDIVIVSDAVSRCHLFFKKTESGWTVQDNNSRNGMLVNGRKVTESPLNPGDRVQVGEFVFKFGDPSASEAVVAPQPQMKAVEVAPPRAASTPTPQTAAVKVDKKRGGKLSQEMSEVSSLADRVVPLGGAKHGQEAWLNLIRDRVLRPAKFYRDQIVYLVMGLTIGLLVISIGVRHFRRRHVPLEPTRREAALANEISKRAQAVTEVGEPVETSAAPVVTPPPKSSGKRLTRDDLNIQKRGRHLRNDKNELSVYLQEGRDYLREGDFESASIAYRFALVIEPGNREAIQGLRTVESKLGRAVMPAPSSPVTSVPSSGSVIVRRRVGKIIASDKKRQALEYLKVASSAFKRRAYQDAINHADKARSITFAGNAAFVAEARALAELALKKQKEDFEPFLNQANEKFNVGDYQGSKDLCEEMLRLDPAYVNAASCVARAEAAMRAKGGN